MLTAIVIAGSFLQYSDWLRRNGYQRSEYRPAFTPRDLEGIRIPKIIYIGSYWDNPLIGSEVHHYVLGKYKPVEVYE
jgi:hypothetical protein